MPRITQKQFKKKNVKYIIFFYYRHILIGFLILVLALEYLIFISPILKKTTNRGELDVGFYQELLTKEKEYLNGLKQMEAKVAKLDQRALSKLDDVMASELNIPELINTFYLIATDNNYKVNSISFSFENGTYLVNLSLSGGDYQSFKNLLSTIENSIRIMDITGLSFSGAGESCNLTIKTYYLD